MTIKVLVLGTLLAALAAAPPMLAQAADQPPMHMPTPQHDYHASPAGTYTIDESHTGVVARVSHIGYSWEVFRFRKVSGELIWDPANPAANKLTVTVEPGSIATAPTGNVDFAAELSSPQFMNVAKYPTATFVSRAFHVIDATHGKVDGDFTIMGKTIPATFDVELVGAGPQFRGPVLGVTAHAQIPVTGLGLPPMFTVPIDLTVDTEFDRKN